MSLVHVIDLFWIPRASAIEANSISKARLRRTGASGRNLRSPLPLVTSLTAMCVVHSRFSPSRVWRLVIRNGATDPWEFECSAFAPDPKRNGEQGAFIDQIRVASM